MYRLLTSYQLSMHLSFKNESRLQYVWTVLDLLMYRKYEGSCMYLKQIGNEIFQKLQLQNL